MQIKAKIFRSGKTHFECKIIDRSEIIEACALSTVLKSTPPVVGDNVELSFDQKNQIYQIEKVLPRKNHVYRELIREKKTKTVASNIDFLAIVTSVSTPAYKAGLIDRYLVRAHQWNIPAMVIFNKMDTYKGEFDLEFEIAKFHYLNIKTFQLSATKTQEYSQELENLSQKLKDKTVMFVGQSGVGKSKLISALSDGKVELLSKELAKGVNKGAHTTTWCEIIDCEHFLLIDSPGIRSMAIEDINSDDLVHYFPDLNQLTVKCQFTNCEHEEKSKGCYFNLLKADDANTQIIKARLDAYKRLKTEVKNTPDWQKKS